MGVEIVNDGEFMDVHDELDIDDHKALNNSYSGGRPRHLDPFYQESGSHLKLMSDTQSNNGSYISGTFEEELDRMKTPGFDERKKFDFADINDQDDEPQFGGRNQKKFKY